MIDYKKMYILLFNTITDVTKELQEAQLDTEEMFMDVVREEGKCKCKEEREEDSE